MVWYGSLWYGIEWCGVVWYDMIWRGVICSVVWFGLVSPGVVWSSVACGGLVWRSLVSLVHCGLAWFSTPPTLILLTSIRPPTFYGETLANNLLSSQVEVGVWVYHTNKYVHSSGP